MRRNKMRMGKRMKHILKVLEVAEKPLTLSEMIVMMIRDSKTFEGRNNKVASALVKSPISLDTMSYATIKRKSGKSYHPYEYAQILYAIYSRSLHTLWEHDLVRCIDHYKTNRKHWILNAKKPFLNV